MNLRHLFIADWPRVIPQIPFKQKQSLADKGI